MIPAARLKPGETLGDRIMKVDHAGEHGAICIYRAQLLIARWRAPEMVGELEAFLAHERRHRLRFGAVLGRRGARPCRSYAWCGLGGFLLGGSDGPSRPPGDRGDHRRHRASGAPPHARTGRGAPGQDAEAVAALADVIADEQSHHDLSAARLDPRGLWPKLINPVVESSTEAVIWLGMRL